MIAQAMSWPDHVAWHVRKLVAEAVAEAVASEREMCAAICQSNGDLQKTRAKTENNDYAEQRAVEAYKCALEIRKRAGKETA